jgi:hypothetical protein
MQLTRATTGQWFKLLKMAWRGNPHSQRRYERVKHLLKCLMGYFSCAVDKSRLKKPVVVSDGLPPGSTVYCSTSACRVIKQGFPSCAALACLDELLSPCEGLSDSNENTTLGTSGGVLVFEKSALERAKIIFSTEVFKMKRRASLLTAGLLSAVALTLIYNCLPFTRAGAEEAGSGSLVKVASCSIEKAEQIALSKYPEATVIEISIDRDDSPLVWEIDMKMSPRTKIEMEINAKTGEIEKNEKHKW